jgi:4-hydroxythreonine-4-phosphate dehydrogenase
MIGLTIGDPGGVGPELIVRAWCQPEFHQKSRLVAIGPAAILQEAARRFAPSLQVIAVDHPDDATSSPTLLPCLSSGDTSIEQIQPGRHGALGGRISYEAVVQGTKWAIAGLLQGLVTCPISKAAWHEAGCTMTGHTELLAQLCGVPETAMMLYLPAGSGGLKGGLGVVHVTLHVSLRQAIESIATELIVRRGLMLNDMMQRLMPPIPSHQPRLGICALNPHAGEEGLFGDEEERLIAPAVAQLTALGCQATGPHPADTLFARAVRGEFDGVVAMVHDQGHVAIKLLAMHSAVNITLGLPIVRTSVAHGTAYDIAWQGVAEITGMQSALSTCLQLIGASQEHV